MNQFSIINVQEYKKDIKLSLIKSILPKKHYLRYIKKYKPTIRRDIEYLGEKGQEIFLPFNVTELAELEEGYIKEFLYSIMGDNEMSCLFMAPVLRKLVYKIDKSLISNYNNILFYIFFLQIMELALEEKKLDKKDMRLMIIDSGDHRIDYILRLLISELNHLTIITERSEYFKEYLDIIYDNTGLLIDINETPNFDENHDNVIIDISNDFYKNFRYFTQDVIVLDLESSMMKRQYLYSRSKHITLVYDLVILNKKHIVDNELFNYILMCKYPRLGDFMNNNYSEYIQRKLTGIKEEYDIKVDKIIYQ